MNRIAKTFLFLAAGTALGLLALPAMTRIAAAAPSEAQPTAAPRSPVAPADPAAAGREAMDKGVDFLKSQQKSDGGWQSENDPPGITAIALEALLRSGKLTTSGEPAKKGFIKLLAYQKPDGAIYAQTLPNYNTALAVSALAAAADPQYKDQLDKATAFLHAMQWTDKTPAAPDGKKVSNADDPWWGGFCYDGKGRPDLSNTSFTLDALHDAGTSLSDPAWKESQVFMTRCQNRSESNKMKFAGDDGGAIYTPGNGDGQSAAGNFVAPDGQRHCNSYGAMTSAFIKGMVYSGVEKQDPRLQAAHEWIGKHWTLDEHPGMALGKQKDGQAGLFYYYHAMARALHAWGDPTITDAKGVKHDWRVEMAHKLASLQKSDGSWAGEKRWFETNPVLVTSYSVLILAEIQQDLKEHPPQ